MNAERKTKLFRKLRVFAKLVGRVGGVQTSALEKRQAEEEVKNVMNMDIEVKNARLDAVSFMLSHTLSCRKALLSRSS